jgi:hypothetical protein
MPVEELVKSAQNVLKGRTPQLRGVLGDDRKQTRGELKHTSESRSSVGRAAEEITAAAKAASVRIGAAEACGTLTLTFARRRSLARRRRLFGSAAVVCAMVSKSTQGRQICMAYLQKGCCYPSRSRQTHLWCSGCSGRSHRNRSRTL